MPIRNLLIAVVVLSLALGYIQFVLLPADSKIPLVVAEVAVSGAKGNFKLVKAENDWILEEVKTAPLNTAKVEELLLALRDFIPGEPLPSADLDSDLAIYGLNPPELTIRTGTAENQPELRFGKRNNYVGARYLQLGDSKEIYLINDSLFDLANVEANSFRKNTPVAFADRDLESIQIVSSRNKFSLVRSNKDWKIKPSENVEYAASSVAVSEFTRALRGLTAKSFIEDAEDKFGLSKPKLEVHLEFADKQPTHLVMSAPGDKRFFSIAGASTVYEALEFATVLKEVTIDQFRETAPLHFDASLVEFAEFSGRDLSEIRLVKVENGWQVNGQPADPVFVAEILKTYSGKLVEAFPAQANHTPSFDQPILTAKFKLTDKSEQVLVVGPTLKYAGAEHFYAKIVGIEEVFLMSKQTLNKLRPKVDVLQSSSAGGELVSDKK